MARVDQRATEVLLAEVRWRLESGERRIDAVAQRVAIIFGFDGVLLSALVATLSLPEAVTQEVRRLTFGAVILVALSAVAALYVLWPRPTPVLSGEQLRGYWTHVREGQAPNVEGELVNAYLGGDKDPLAATALLVKRRSTVYAVSLGLLGLAMTLTGVVVVLATTL